MTTQNTHTTARRLAWLIAGLNFVLLLAAIILTLVLFQTPENGFTELAQDGLGAVNVVVYSMLGLLIISRFPRHTIGWLFVVLGFLGALALLASSLLVQENLINSDFVVGLIHIINHTVWIPWLVLPLSLVILLFPDGRLPSRRWWPVATAAVLGTLGYVASIALHPWPWEDIGIIDTYNPLAIAGTTILFEQLSILFGISFGVGIIGSLAAVVVRFRKSAGIERAQMKWLIYAAGLSISIFVLFFIFDRENQFFDLAVTAFPTLIAAAITLAILRYRLWDIDIIINRTLVYGSLTAILALLYFGTVTLAQSLFVTVSGEESPAAIVLSTLAIAALFTPLRRRIQDVIDRRFYRRKYDAEKALSDFSLTVREEVDLENLSLALLSVVDETMQPESVSVWLKDLAE